MKRSTMTLISLSIAVLFISSASSLSISRKVRSAVEVPSKLYTNGTTSIVANYGDTVQFNCYSTDNPPTPVTWYKSFYESDDILPNGEMSYEGNVLKFPSVTQRSQGSYICDVSNEHTYAKLYYSLKVRSKPLIKQTTQEHILGSQIQLKCVAACTPKSTFKWYKNGERYTVEDTEDQYKYHTSPFVSDDVKSSITISTTDNYKGSYKCEIENEFGKDEKVFEIDA